MSLAINRHGVLHWFTNLFRSKDPIKKSILDSVVILDRMIRSIETSKKSLETILQENERKARVYGGGDKEISEILSEEYKNAQGYMVLLSKVSHDLARIRYRLETLAYVQEPLKLLPEVLEELRKIEPEVERFNPQLLTYIRMVEQKVGNILIATSTDTSPTPLSKRGMVEEDVFKQSVREAGRQEVKLPPPPPQEVAGKKAELVQTNTQPVNKVEVARRENTHPPIGVVEQWLLRELNAKGGILDMNNFSARYGVPKEVVFEALMSLEKKGAIRLKRK